MDTSATTLEVWSTQLLRTMITFPLVVLNDSSSSPLVIAGTCCFFLALPFLCVWPILSKVFHLRPMPPCLLSISSTKSLHSHILQVRILLSIFYCFSPIVDNEIHFQTPPCSDVIPHRYPTKPFLWIALISRLQLKTLCNHMSYFTSNVLLSLPIVIPQHSHIPPMVCTDFPKSSQTSSSTPFLSHPSTISPRSLRNVGNVFLVWRPQTSIVHFPSLPQLPLYS